MTDKKLTLADARALLSEHVDDSLDASTKAEVDALLAHDASLAVERRRLAQTMALLKELPRPEAPADIVGKVRDRLAAERRGESASTAASASLLPAEAQVLRPRWRRFGGVEVAVGLAAAASIAIFVAVAGVGVGGASNAHGVGTAGTAGDVGAVTATVVVPGIPKVVVMQLATKAGMETVRSTMDGQIYEGDRRAAGRFVIELKAAAAERGVEVSGFIPDAERVRIEVRDR